MKLADTPYADIRNGNTLLVCCQGTHDGKGRCAGMLRVPFSPPIGGAPEPKPLENGMVWKRESGETLDTISLSPSIDGGSCGHFCVRDGRII